MEFNFMEEIKVAEQKAASIVEEAELEARSTIDRTRREVVNFLENARLEADEKRRQLIGEAEQNSRAYLSSSAQALRPLEVSETDREEAARQVAERIVNYLGNS